MGKRSNALLVVLTALVVVMDGFVVSKLRTQVATFMALRQRNNGSVPAIVPTAAATEALVLDGKRLGDVSTRGAAWLVMFVLHPRNEQAELDSWEGAARALNDPGVLFVACCRVHNCAARLKASPFPVVTDLSLQLAQALAKEDEAGSFIVVSATRGLSQRVALSRRFDLGPLLRGSRDAPAGMGRH